MKKVIFAIMLLASTIKAISQCTPMSSPCYDFKNGLYVGTSTNGFFRPPPAASSTAPIGSIYTNTSGQLFIKGASSWVIIGETFTSLTTNGTSGVATLTSGVLNVPNYTFNPTAGTNISITGTYPNLTFNNTAPNVNLIAGDHISITGTYPNKTIASIPFNWQQSLVASSTLNQDNSITGGGTSWTWNNLYNYKSFANNHWLDVQGSGNQFYNARGLWLGHCNDDVTKAPFNIGASGSTTNGNGYFMIGSSVGQITIQDKDENDEFYFRIGTQNQFVVAHDGDEFVTLTNTGTTGKIRLENTDGTGVEYNSSTSAGYNDVFATERYVLAHSGGSTGWDDMLAQGQVQTANREVNMESYSTVFYSANQDAYFVFGSDGGWSFDNATLTGPGFSVNTQDYQLIGAGSGNLSTEDNFTINSNSSNVNLNAGNYIFLTTPNSLEILVAGGDGDFYLSSTNSNWQANGDIGISTNSGGSVVVSSNNDIQNYCTSQYLLNAGTSIVTHSDAETQIKAEYEMLFAVGYNKSFQFTDGTDERLYFDRNNFYRSSQNGSANGHTFELGQAGDMHVYTNDGGQNSYIERFNITGDIDKARINAWSSSMNIYADQGSELWFGVNTEAHQVFMGDMSYAGNQTRFVLDDDNKQGLFQAKNGLYFRGTDANFFFDQIKTDNFDNDRVHQLPNANGTLAISVNSNTADANGNISLTMPTPGLENVIYNNPNFTSGYNIGGGNNNLDWQNFYNYKIRGNNSIQLTTQSGAGTITAEGYNVGRSINGVYADNAGAFDLTNTVPIVKAYQNATGRTAANYTLATLTVPSTASNSTYEIGGYLTVTAISLNSITLQVVYTDETNTSRTQMFSVMGTTSPNVTLTGAYTFPNILIRAKASTTITVSTVATGAGSQTYDAGGYITKIN